MIHAQNTKFFPLINSQAIVDDAYFSGSHQHGSVNNDVDVAGWKYGTFTFWLGATDIAMAELSLYYSDDDSTYTLLSASNFATAGTLPSATDDNTAVKWFVDFKKYPYRYWRINAKAGNGAAGSFGVGWVELSNGDVDPATATNRGLSQNIILG